MYSIVRNTCLAVCLLISLLLLLGGCEVNRLKSAEELYAQKRYAASIGELDVLIENGNNGALVTRAELLRSNSYFALGEAAEERKNLPLAIRFYKLSNSDGADLRLAELYMQLSAQAFRNGEPDIGKAFLDAIIREAPSSPRIPEVLYRRISYRLDVDKNQDAAWKDYMLLYDSQPNNPFEIQARSIATRFIPGKLEYAGVLANQGYHTEALNILFEIAKYPVADITVLNKQISDVYQQQAELFLEDQNYSEADRLFRIAMQYYPEKDKQIQKRLEAITSLYVSKGNSLLEAGDFANALVHYRKTFDIIPDYQPALDAINRLLTRQENIRRAAETSLEGDKLEAAGRIQDALKAYNAAYSLDAKPEYRAKAIQMQNLIDASTNPLLLVKRIIDEYKGGLLVNRIKNQKQDMLKRYKASEIRDSGWKILLSTGQHKYEVRYDLMAANETYLYLWQVNLRDKSIIPLNKLSEAMLK